MDLLPSSYDDDRTMSDADYDEFYGYDEDDLDYDDPDWTDYGPGYTKL